jgi:imidazolonepropionase-like amidohydrolase
MAAQRYLRISLLPDFNVTVTLTDLTIWDGNNLIDADTLQFRAGVITFIGQREDARISDPAVSCAGLTLLPGLIDAHVHLELNPDEKDPPDRTRPEVIPLMRERAAKMAAAGITTARDLGGGAWFELTLRDEIAAGQTPGPRLICAGQPITTPSGHCHFWGGQAASASEAHAVLQRQVEQGVDLIKIMATGGRMTKGSQPTDAQFSQATLSALVAAAHAQELPVAAHCHGTEGIKRAAHACVDSIEHCSWVGPEGWASDYQAEVAEIILENKVWISPTVNKGWQRMLDNPSGKVLGRVRSAYQQMLDKGIPMMASTDAGIPGVYHADLPHALKVFAGIAQLDQSATLKSATSAAALGLGISNITGNIEVGKSADLLIVDGDPLRDLTALTQPVHVFCAGRQVTA